MNGHSATTNIASRPSDLIGNTPLIDLTRILTHHNIDGVRLVGKLESLGPCSSVKDRLALSMINEAEKDGTLTPGHSVIVEPTSGNTGIALAFLARERNYRCIICMPESMSIERRMMLLALGAEVVLTPKEYAVSGAARKAEEIVANLPDGVGVILDQFSNPANAKMHRETTGPEIWRDTAGQLDVLVSGVGTGGTLTGTSQFIKGSEEHGCPPKKAITTIAVEPKEQMLITEAKGGTKEGPQGPHRIQGIGAGIIPKVLDVNIVDEVVAISSTEAESMTQELWMMGLPTGISAGAIVAAATQVAARSESEGKMIVAIIPSFGERYFTHPMFAKVKKEAEEMKKQEVNMGN